jgi:hypothetical protein
MFFFFFFTIRCIFATWQHICYIVDDVKAIDMYFEGLATRKVSPANPVYFIHDVIRPAAY